MTHLTWIVRHEIDWLVTPAGRLWHACCYGSPVAIFDTKKPAMNYARELRTWCLPHDIFFESEPNFIDLELLTLGHYSMTDGRRKPTEGEKKARDKIVKLYPHDTQCDVYAKMGASVPGGRIDTCCCGATQSRRKVMRRLKIMM